MDPGTRDDRLSAWLDDALDAGQRAEVEAWLRDHPDDVARVRMWAADRDALRARLGPVADEPVPTRLEELVRRQAAPPRPQPRWHGARRWAAALAVFVGGGMLGAAAMWRLDRSASLADASQRFEHRAMVAHAVYVPEVRHPVEVAVTGMSAQDAQAQEQHLVRWLTKRIDRPVTLFDLRGEGFDLVGGRLLADAAGPCAQLMYERRGASPPVRVTVYLRKPEPGTPAAFRYLQDGPLGSFYWVEGTTGYALVGALPRGELLALAEAIYRQVGR